MRRRVMRKTQTSSSKVKVILGGQRSDTRMTNPEHFFFMHGGILMKLDTIVHHHETECHAQFPSLELLPFVVTINSLYCNFFITSRREKSRPLFCSTICMFHPILRCLLTCLYLVRTFLWSCNLLLGVGWDFFFKVNSLKIFINYLIHM